MSFERGNLLRADDLEARFLQAQNYERTAYYFGAKGDGTDQTAAVQAAINWSAAQNKPVFFPAGAYKITSALTIPASATSLTLICDPKARFEGYFTTTGSSGMLVNADLTGAGNGTTRPRNVTIIGGDWGKPYTAPASWDGSASAVSYGGNIFSIIADDMLLADVRMSGLGAGGRFFIGGGERFRITRPTWLYGIKATGSGGCRILAGSGLVSDGVIYCGDDVCQVVQAETGPFANLDVGHVVFRDMRGRSWGARFLVVAITDQDAGSQATYSCSTRRVDFIRCSGSGYAFICNFSNIDSTGTVGEINVIDCDISDDSPSGSVSTPYGIYVDGGIGLSRGGAMGIGILRILRTTLRQPQKNAMKTTGEIGTILLEDNNFQAPKQVDGATLQVNRAQKLLVRRGQYVPGAGQNVFSLGLSGDTTMSVDVADFDGVVCSDVPELGDGSYNYGISFVRGGAASVRGRMRVEPRSASTYVRFANVGANFPLVNIASADLRQITATTPIIDSGPSTTYGGDILTASGAPYRQGFQTIAASTDTLTWDGKVDAYGQALIRVSLTADTTIDTVTPTITPATPVRLTLRAVTAGFSLTVAAHTVGNAGNIYMPSDVTLAQHGSIDLVWDPANAYWIGVN